jgi:hypothetical protein
VSETINVNALDSPPPSQGRPVVLVPYFSSVEKECDDGLRGLGQAGVLVRRASYPAIDLLRSVMLSHALRDGFDRFLFIDADIGFDPADALRLLDRPEPVVAGVYVKKRARDLSGTFAAGIQQVVLGPTSPGPYPMLYAAAGFLRIKAEVLTRMIEKLKLPECHSGSMKGIYPFFLPMCVPDGRGGTRYLSEDYSFSYRLHQIGITPLADTSIRLLHYGRHGFSYEDLNPSPKQQAQTFKLPYAKQGARP